MCSLIEPLGSSPRVKVLGIIKEPELSESEVAANPSSVRGTEEFARIFSCADGIYLDSERTLYAQLGGRKLTDRGQMFNPCAPPHILLY